MIMPALQMCGHNQETILVRLSTTEHALMIITWLIYGPTPGYNLHLISLSSGGLI